MQAGKEGGSECVPNNARYGRLTCGGEEGRRTEHSRKGEEGGVLGGAAAAGRPPTFLRAIRRRQPDITPTHPYVLLAFLPFPYYVLNPLYGKWSAPSDFQWMTEGLSLPPTQIGCDL